MAMEWANKFVQFVNNSPSPFHAVHSAKERLVSSSFTELQEGVHWDLKPSGKYFVVRNQSTILAFIVGGKFKPSNTKSSFAIVGAHTDSPCLKLRPASTKVKCGFVQCGVQLYGGGNWLSWFDRDLKLAGRVVVRGQSDSLASRLVHINRPIMRVPFPAIHLHREMNENFGLNKETHLQPIIATAVQEKLQVKSVKHTTGGADGDQKPFCDCHPPVLVSLLADELRVDPASIVDFELCLADTQPACIGGALNEFIFSPRIDNLMCSFAALEALIAASAASPDAETGVRMIALFDNEEVGSESAQGAMSALFEYVLRRVTAAFADQATATTAFEEVMARSFILSADMAHAVHPNYAEKHEENHRPSFHGGPVLKINANQRYATTAATGSIIREIARRASVPLQDFVIRSDLLCGSTIGPICAARLGVQTADVGMPQLSMHSIRETADTSGPSQGIQLFQAFLNNYGTVSSSFTAE